jgi:hypothetical protein
MILLNGLPAISFRRFTPWAGAWTVEVDLELDATMVEPSGRCILTAGAKQLVGTIDPTASGRFGSTFRASVTGGGGGWSGPVTDQAFHSDGGLLSTIPIAATAAEVGEVAVVEVPVSLGTDFARSSKLPASQVFRGADWYVDALGITHVGPRLEVPLVDPDVVVLSYDGNMQTAEIATDTILEPGMILTDSRFGQLTIRQVEQRFDVDGARATVWVSSSSSVAHSLGGAIGKLARIAVGLPSLRSYKYTVISQGGDGRLVLKVVNQSAGIPDQLPISILYGIPGCTAKVAPGTVVVLRFLEGDPGQPIVESFDGTPCLEVAVSSLSVKLGMVPEPIAKGPETVAAFMGIEAFTSAMATAESTFASSGQALPDCVAYLHAIGSASAALATALGLTVGLIPATTIQGGP